MGLMITLTMPPAKSDPVQPVQEKPPPITFGSGASVLGLGVLSRSVAPRSGTYTKIMATTLAVVGILSPTTISLRKNGVEFAQVRYVANFAQPALSGFSGSVNVTSGDILEATVLGIGTAAVLSQIVLDN